MKIPFKISEFTITGDSLPIAVADKILKYHIEPMTLVREILGLSLYPSQHSGYRPHSWELSHGRSGNSQHTFSGKGAVDWTCKDFKTNKDDLLNTLIDNTDYTRIAIYNSFIHCDYKDTPSGKKEIYASTSKSKWTLINTI